VSFARRRLNTVIDRLPEAEKLYAGLALCERREPESIAASLGLNWAALQCGCQRAVM
jgi:hypothetical protein